MSKFSLNTKKNNENIKAKVSLDDVLDSPGKNLDEIIEDKKNTEKFPWEDKGLSKKDISKYLWGMKKEYYLKLEWVKENTGHNKSRILSDIVYPALDKKIDKFLKKDRGVGLG